MTVHVRPVLLTLIALVGLAGCRGEEPTEPIPRETFVEVMVELRRAVNENSSQAEFEARKAEVLEKANVTDSALVEYARLYGRRLDYMAEVWDSVNARLRAVEDSLH